MTSPPELPIHPGDVLLDKYRIERVLGAGGMGAVVEATHLGLDQRVAMKFMLPQVADRADNVMRFMREARAASKLRSEHIPRVFDFGSLETKIPYLVMELLQGEDLAHKIEHQSRLDVAEVCEVGIQACEALSEAHGLGIIHRDLKPANLFVTYRTDGSPCTKVLDFGIAKEPFETGTLDPKGLTATGAMMGSPPYMSPEQLDSARRVDARSDIWSLGVALYEALTGTRPFVSDNLGGLIMCILDTVPELPSTVRADIPLPLSQAVMKCIQRRPEDRHQNVFEVATALAPFAPSRCHVLLDRIAANCRIVAITKRGNALLESLETTAEAPVTDLLGGSIQESEAALLGTSKSPSEEAVPGTSSPSPEAALKFGSQTNDAMVRTSTLDAGNRLGDKSDKPAAKNRWLGVIVAAALGSAATAFISSRLTTQSSTSTAAPATHVSATIPVSNDSPKVEPTVASAPASAPSTAAPASAMTSVTTTTTTTNTTPQPSRSVSRPASPAALPDYGGRK